MGDLHIYVKLAGNNHAEHFEVFSYAIHPSGALTISFGLDHAIVYAPGVWLSFNVKKQLDEEV